MTASGSPLQARRDYEVEVTLIVTAASYADAKEAVELRSGVYCGALIGEALVDSVTVYGQEDEAE